MEWPELKQMALDALERQKLSPVYQERLEKEIYEIEKQGANALWVDYYERQEKWDKNVNGLILPWLLGLVSIDPIKGISKIMIESPNGVDDETIVIKLENNQEICVSPNTQILTNVGYVKASELNSDHTIP
jgi:intein/homing endonuclease